MAWFPAASQALDCARTIQTIVAETSTADLAVKIGINSGEPIAEEDDLYGIAVQIAARVTDQAGAGEIVVTNVVRELVAGKGYLFAEREPAALKGGGALVAMIASAIVVSKICSSPAKPSSKTCGPVASRNSSIAT